MFTYEYGLALVVGLFFSIPIGPMGMLATSMWLEGYKRAACNIVGGICLGDALVGIIVLSSLKLAATVDIPKSVIVLVMLFVAYLLWQEAGHRRHGFPLKRLWRYGAMAFCLTLAQPSNWIVFWGVYQFKPVVELGVLQLTLVGVYGGEL